MSGTGLPAFSEIYELHHADVLAWARRLIGADEAEDIAQEVFCRIDRSLPELRDPARLTAWIYAITLNAVRDAARRQAARERRTDGAVEAAGAAEPAQPTPEDAVMRSEMIACYLEHVARLPARHREAYVLREFAELSIEDIARQLAVTVGTVKIRLHRARARLYEELRCDCRLFYTERGELMAEPRDGVSGALLRRAVENPNGT